jgi:hypothetical protein
MKAEPKPGPAFCWGWEAGQKSHLLLSRALSGCDAALIFRQLAVIVTLAVQALALRNHFETAFS